MNLFTDEPSSNCVSRHGCVTLSHLAYPDPSLASELLILATTSRAKSSMRFDENHSIFPNITTGIVVISGRDLSALNVPPLEAPYSLKALNPLRALHPRLSNN